MCRLVVYNEQFNSVTIHVGDIENVHIGTLLVNEEKNKALTYCIITLVGAIRSIVCTYIWMYSHLVTRDKKKAHTVLC